MNVKPKERACARIRTPSIPFDQSERCAAAEHYATNSNLWNFFPLVIYCALFVFVAIQIYFLTFFPIFFCCSFHLVCDSTLKKVYVSACASNKPIYANDAILPLNSFQSSIKCETLWVAIWFHINSVSMLLLCYIIIIGIQPYYVLYDITSYA